jgi:hypothetical protein
MRLFRRIISPFLLLLLGITGVLRAQGPGSTASEQWGDSVRALAAEIAASTAPSHSISLSVRNISSITAAEASSIEQELRAGVAQRGLKIADFDSAETTVQVTLSENAAGLLWVAEIRSRAGSKIAIVSPSIQKDDSSVRPAPLLRKSLLLRQREAILDFAQIPSPSGGRALLLLEPDQVTMLQSSADSWVALGSALVQHTQSWPRDLRGRIVLSASGGFQAFLPGVVCTGNWVPSLTAKCEEGGASWTAGSLAVSFVTARNYLASSIPGTNGSKIDLPMAYSEASSASGSASPREILTGVDGTLSLIGNNTMSVLPAGHWGDEIAPIAPACGSNWDVLATAPGDWTQLDRLQTYEIASVTAAPVGDPIEFAGPILALWPSEDGTQVRAVSRNLETGMYEASILSISCGN